jgi:hypothetical protein
MDWWRTTNELDFDLVRKGLNSMIILGAWTLWWNCCIFDGIAPKYESCHHSSRREKKGVGDGWSKRDYIPDGTAPCYVECQDMSIFSSLTMSADVT